MMVKLTEQEREVWKDAYKLHETFYDMAGTEEDWKQFILNITLINNKYENSPKAKRLSFALLLALCNYFEEEQKIAQAKTQDAPEQLAMAEVIPWT